MINSNTQNTVPSANPSQPAASSGNVALLIDWENIKLSTLESLQTPPDIITLKKIARRYGTLRIGRAYANWTDPTGWHSGDVERLAALGIEPVFVPTRRFKGERTSSPYSYEKDLVDLRLACDGMELLATHPEIGCFVVASGDGALETLLGKLSSAGKRVVRVAVEASMSKGSRVLGEERVSYDRWIEGFRLQQNEAVDRAIELFARAVDELAPGKSGCGLDSVKIQMLRELPDFDEELLGIPTFRHLAYLAEAKKYVQIDASIEPARAYPVGQADWLPNAGDWMAFIDQLDGGKDYNFNGLSALCEDAGFNEDAIKSMIKAAVDADVLVRTTDRFVGIDFETQQTKDMFSVKYRLNTHHPRVQIAFATRPEK